LSHLPIFSWLDSGAPPANRITVGRQLLLLSTLLLGMVLPTTAAAQLTPNVGLCPVSDLQKRNRPNIGAAPVQVSIGVLLIDIMDIHEGNETFDADFALRLQWRDPRLSIDELGVSLEDCDVNLRDIWHPQIGIINQAGVEFGGWQRLEVDGDGNVNFVHRISGRLTTPFVLDKFPRDSQQLVIRFTSLGYGTEDVLLEIDSAWSGRAPNARISGWEIVDNASDVVSPTAIAAGMSHALVFHTISVDREFGYWFWKLIVPLSLIVLMAWAVFWLDPQTMAPQITVGASSIFTLIAFQLSLGESLPRISYLTNADELVLTATLLVFLALGQAVLTSRLATRNEIEFARRLDLYGRWIYPLLYLAGMFIAFV
jgi:hypothetical protein